MNLSNQLRVRREARNLKHEDIANLMNVSRPTYTSWESGRHIPSLEQIIKLADFYETSLDHLVGRYESYTVPTFLISKKALKKE